MGGRSTPRRSLVNGLRLPGYQGNRPDKLVWPGRGGKKTLISSLAINRVGEAKHRIELLSEHERRRKNLSQHGGGGGGGQVQVL